MWERDINIDSKTSLKIRDRKIIMEMWDVCCKCDGEITTEIWDGKISMETWERKISMEMWERKTSMEMCDKCERKPAWKCVTSVKGNQHGNV